MAAWAPSSCYVHCSRSCTLSNPVRRLAAWRRLEFSRAWQSWTGSNSLLATVGRLGVAITAIPVARQPPAFSGQIAGPDGSAGPADCLRGRVESCGFQKWVTRR